MENRVWVIGSANYDTTYRLDHLPARGETMLGPDCAASPGGKGLNQAIAAVSGGARVAFISAVGNDGPGERLLRTLGEFGVDVSRVAVLDGLASGHAIINVDRNGDNTIVVHPGTNNLVPVSDAEVFMPGDIAVAQLEIPLETARHYLRLARRCGATTVLNPSPATGQAAGLLPVVDILVLNEIEASRLGGIEVVDTDSALAAARKIMELGAGMIVLTLGADGVVVVQSGRAFHIPGIAVTAVDTQGAGDIFLGYFVARLCGGSSFADAAVAANYFAGQAVQHHGSTYPSLQKIALAAPPPASEVIPL